MPSLPTALATITLLALFATVARPDYAGHIAAATLLCWVVAGLKKGKRR